MKTYSTKAFDLIDTLIRMSPSHKRIAFKFFVWPKYYKVLMMGIAHIAEVCECSEDTVYRFFKKYSHLVKRKHRWNTSNLYFPQEIFVQAMQILDDNKMFEKTRRQQKNWYAFQMRKELHAAEQNVGICDPLCPNLRPYPLLYPQIQVLEPSAVKHNFNSCGNWLLDQLPMELWQKKVLMKYPEQILVEAMADCKWFAARQSIRNPFGLFLSRAKDHQSRKRRNERR